MLGLGAETDRQLALVLASFRMADLLRMRAETLRDPDDRADRGLVADDLHAGAEIEGPRQLLERQLGLGADELEQRRQRDQFVFDVVDAPSEVEALRLPAAGVVDDAGNRLSALLDDPRQDRRVEPGRRQQ